MASLSEDQTAELKEYFELFDLNGDGFIRAKDLGPVMRGFGISLTEQSLKNMIDEVDPKGRGQIMYNDYLTLMARRMTDPSLSEDTILESFSVLDKDKNGTVNASELKHIMTKMGEFLSSEECDSILKEAQIDRNGNINYADFVRQLNDSYAIFP